MREIRCVVYNLANKRSKIQHFQKAWPKSSLWLLAKF
jgi:hypothetical protein